MTSSLTNPTFKPLSASDKCLLSLPSFIFAFKTTHQCLSISTKPIKLRLSAPRPKIHFPSLISHVAQASDWAQQDEEEEEGGATWGSEDGAAEGGEEEEEDGGYVEPPEEAKIFVGNLPYDLDSQKLAQLFENSGTVEIAEVIYNRETDSSRGFGFVTMSTVEEAEKAVEQMHEYEIGGRALTVTKAAPRGTRAERPARDDDSGYNIYVGNIPWDVDSVRLEQIFSEHGKVVSAKVIYDRETGRSRGFGFVSMASETEMSDAIAALDGQNLDGRSIRVNVAETRPRRAF